MKMDWDNVGLLCGSRSTPVTKILVALDPFEQVCDEAAAWGAELIVTHHPIIFQAMKSVTDETSIGRGIMELCSHGISAINAHTNLDSCPMGVNYELAQLLDLTDIDVTHPVGADTEGRPFGLLRSGDISEMPLEDFLAHVKARLGTPTLRFVDGGKPVRRVAVGGGSCAGAMMQAIDDGCDTFVTADVKYNQFRTAYELGVNLIDAGHFHTENPTMPIVAGKLRKAFPGVEVIFSEKHQDVMRFY
jgi:dinuclear metal center YbgI/SA1388 family protein